MGAMLICMRFLVLLFVTVLQLGAQSWDSMSQLRPGDQIRVLEVAGTEYKGKFSAVTGEAIILRTAKNEVSVERSRVRRVQIRSGGRRVRNLLIGAAIGVAVGVVIDQTLGQYLRNESGENGGARAVTYVAPIGVLGGIAAARPAYRTIFQR